MKLLRSLPVMALVLLFPALVLAQVATTTTSTVVSLDQLLVGGVDTYQAFKVGGVLAGLAALMNVLINATKFPVLAEYIKRKKLKWIRPVLALILGFIGGLSSALATGQSWGAAILYSVAGIFVGGGAVLLHELYTALKGKRDE